ncbi:hypothetical protein Bca52824_045896 [Brassica carinata]|uniref:TF-B3 domain-containing protein n=1 Tax=Brassica carinata TaxID=52824 RepID=A0A8X7UPL3_BRACI|nr:hypothetical protein Bca52824_045896 [Brassica carinata]
MQRRGITGGKLVIEVTYFGWHIHSETHDLCSETTCPVETGDFLVAHSQVLPGYTPPDIPVAFFLKHLERNNKRKTAKLRSDASETTWRVEIDGQRLSDGWEDFAVGHDLRLGDTVIFRHEGELVFHVTALGPSCSEIQYGGYSDEEEDKKGKS